MAEYRALRAALLPPRDLPPARARGRRHAAAGRRHRRRRRDPLFRSAAALHADGARLRFRQGRRAVDRAARSARRPTSIGCATSSRARRSRTCSRRSGSCARSWRTACRSSASAARRSRSRRTRSKAGRRRTTRGRRRSCTRSPAAWHRLCDRFADDDGRLPARAGRGGRAGDADLRFVGRRARPRRLPRVRAAAHRAHLRRARRRRACRSIHFGVGTTAILPDLAEAGGDVIGVDWRRRSTRRGRSIGHDRAIQGNLDPTLLLGPTTRLFAAADDVLRRARRPPRPHLQSRPRRPAEHVARARAGARAPRARIQALRHRIQVNLRSLS